MAHRYLLATIESFLFPPYCLDQDKGLLLRDGAIVHLRPKTYEVLVCLVSRAGAVVSKSEIQQQVWPEARTVDGVVRDSISELRKMFGDTRGTPAYIETVHGRGFRFIAALEERPQTHPEGHLFVGRRGELARLRGWFQDAMRGRRRFVILSGDAGMGKTSLVSEMLRDAAAGSPPFVLAQGACRRNFESEAYMPVIELLDSVLRDSPRPLGPVFQRTAPAWTSVLPGLDPQYWAAPTHATPFVMMREGSALLEAVATVTPLVVIFEDVHWADQATLDLLEYLAARDRRVPLLLIATCRRADPSVGAPVRRFLDLRRSGVVETLELEPLPVEDQRAYLTRKFGGETGERWSGYVERWSSGNPLMMELVTRELEGILRRRHEEDANPDIPAEVLGLIDRRLIELPADHVELLETASVCDSPFTLETIADIGQTEHDEAARILRGLLENSPFLVRLSRGDGEAARFHFSHAVHQTCLSQRLLPARRRLLHERLAEHLERTSGGTLELAGTLATHFHAAGRPERAVPYFEMAAFNDIRRNAHREAADLVRTALSLLERIPIGPERWHTEARLAQMLGHLATGCLGFSHPEVRQAHARAQAAFEAIGDHSGAVRSMLGISGSLLFMGELAPATRVSSSALTVAEEHASGMRAQVYAIHASSLISKGELEAARAMLEQSLELDGEPSVPGAVDPRVTAHAQLAFVLMLTGEIGRGRASRTRAIERARELGGGVDLAAALGAAVMGWWQEGDPDGLAEGVTEARALQDRYRYPSFSSVMGIYEAALELERRPDVDSIRKVRDAMAVRTQSGERLYDTGVFAGLSHRAVALGEFDLAATLMREGRLSGAERGEHWFDAELWRVEAAIAAARARGTSANGIEEAASCLMQALAIARQQGARLWELRAATDMAFLASDHPLHEEAQSTLAAALEPFRSEPRIPDVERAQSALQP